MVRREIEVLEVGAVRASELDGAEEKERVARLVALGKALSDPIRVQMLGVLAAAMIEGRGCCDLPDLGVPVAGEEDSLGICVCEFMDYYQMGQSKVSYHLGKLKEAGLVHEKRRGKWSFYSLDGEAARQLLTEAADQLGAPAPDGSGR
ncbi:MAG TPA: metalloregulator ArsR/SmtB family transcription factor [Rubrobacteraceae bacterium]|nr:metalloregulator ArsR/SmtB family transcription factor [Rubrobacteraceae bacterium]